MMIKTSFFMYIIFSLFCPPLPLISITSIELNFANQTSPPRHILWQISRWTLLGYLSLSTLHKTCQFNHSNQIGEFYKNIIKKGPVLILRDNTIIIHINLRWHMYYEKHISASILERKLQLRPSSVGMASNFDRHSRRS